SRLGTRPAEDWNLMRSGGRHIALQLLSDGIWDQRGRLDLDPRAILDEAFHLDQRHRREVTADDVAPACADLGETVEILPLVDDVPGHPRDVLRPRVGGSEDRHRVPQGLPQLADEIVALPALPRRPADLPGNEDEPAAPG